MTTPWFDTRTSVKAWLVVLAVLAAVVVLFLTTGRGGRIVVDGPVARHERGWGLGGTSGMDAIVGGVLAYEDGCLLLDGDPVIWPDGTEWDDDATGVRLPNGALATPGTSVRGGGGSISVTPEIEALLGDCLGSASSVTTFNADSDVDVVG